MPITYFVSPYQPPQWGGNAKLQIDVNQYIQELLSTWKEAKVSINAYSETYVVYWQIPSQDNTYINGGLQKGGQIISCEGSPEEVASFAIWHRRTVDTNQALYLFDESLHINMELTSATSFEEILTKLR